MINVWRWTFREADCGLRSDFFFFELPLTESAYENCRMVGLVGVWFTLSREVWAVTSGEFLSCVGFLE